MYDKENNQHLAQPDTASTERGVCRFHCLGRHFVDKHNDEWVKVGDTVIRVRDGHVGNWYDGKGLTPLGEEL